MCIRDSPRTTLRWGGPPGVRAWRRADGCADAGARRFGCGRPGADTWYGLSRDSSPHRATWHRPVSYTHLRAHETVLDLVCRLLLEKKKKNTTQNITTANK